MTPPSSSKVEELAERLLVNAGWHNDKTYYHHARDLALRAVLAALELAAEECLEAALKLDCLIGDGMDRRMHSVSALCLRTVANNIRSLATPVESVEEEP